MAGIFSFKCSCCKAIHEGSPSFSFAAPIYYDQIAETDRAQKAKLTSDLCVIGNEDFFVRVCLEIAIRGVSEPFLWGVWATLSQKNFDRYVETYNAPVESDSYFGWFSNKLPYYPDTLNLKTTVRPRPGGIRPYLVLEQSDHPLALDFHNGISILRAQEIAEHIMHRETKTLKDEGK